jgi:hypothetical protein
MKAGMAQWRRNGVGNGMACGIAGIIENGVNNGMAYQQYQFYTLHTGRENGMAAWHGISVKAGGSGVAWLMWNQ